ncbi:MAG: tRNA (adenosine(37)-N6)-dimethylallyltransferase MiaA [Patescibacteria group bacterium]|nr:tRNA (adenosine(37)-N6)-dimethylallyltransferase MiaA [Patescibacteria group bacterium]
MRKQKLIAVVGPTSSGKTALGIWLAKKIGGEIISADSRQVYKGLNLGTGKATPQEMQGVPHHLLNVANPKRQFSADDFTRLGQKAITLIYQSGRLPIIVGGTGFYVDALLGRLTLPNVPPNPRLRKQLDKKDARELFLQLKKLDPARAKTIEPNHKRRLIRAIEIARAIGVGTKPSSSPSRTRRSDPGLAPLSRYDVLWLGLNPAPETLKKNIHARLRARIKAGMIAEARTLHAKGLSYKRMEELGLEYKSLALLLQNKVTKEECMESLERAIQHYAKRQVRWFKRNPDIRWIKNPPGSRAGKSEALRLSKKFIAK